MQMWLCSLGIFGILEGKQYYKKMVLGIKPLVHLQGVLEVLLVR